MLCAAERAAQPPSALVLVGDPAGRQALATAAKQAFAPQLVIAHGGDEGGPLAPSWTAHREPQGGQATAHLCRGAACEAPITDPAALKALLKRPIRR